MKGIKKLLCIALTLAVTSGAMIGCGKSEADTASDDKGTTATDTTTPKDPKDLKGEITFWHFNKDEGPKMAEAFMKKYPNVKVNVQIISDQDQGYQNKVTQTLQGGSDAPDVLVAEAAFVKRFVNLEGAFDDLSKAPYSANDIISNMVPSTVDIGRDDQGTLRALTYQVTPGAIGYKRDMAKQYFGTDDPDKISEMMSTPEKMLDMARQLKEKSGGKAAFFASRQDMLQLYLGARQTGWVKDGALVIDPMIDKYIDIAKTYRDEKLEAGLDQWSQPWSASIAKNDVFAYAVPTWGVRWILGANNEANMDKGLYALANSPIPYCWGGTWLGVYSGSKNKEIAWEFVKFITADKDQMKSWSADSGDFMNNKTLIDELATSGPVNKIINQNPYQVFKPSLDKINGKLFTEYDDRITAAFNDNLGSYLAGKIKTKDEMIKKFKEKVKSDFADLKVD